MRTRFFASLQTLGVAAVALHVAGCSSEPPTTVVPPPPEDKVVETAVPPPPISGGTLIMSQQGMLAIASDPDRNMIWFADLSEYKALGERAVKLADGDEPGRLVEDGKGRVHVILRGTGELVTIDIATGGGTIETKAGRTKVCSAPRGIAYDPAFVDPNVMPALAPIEALHVVCAGGELVTLPTDPGAKPIRTLHLADDLRDVIVDGDELLITRFRSAGFLVLDKAGNEVQPKLLPATANTSIGAFTPSVAYKAVPLANGAGVAVVHQRSSNVADKLHPINLDDPGAYKKGADCASTVVQGSVSMFLRGADTKLQPAGVGSYLGSAILAVDVAVAKEGDIVASISAGNDEVLRIPMSLFTTGDFCGNSAYKQDPETFHSKIPGQPIAVAFDFIGRVVVQTREPAALFILEHQWSGKAEVASAPIRLTDGVEPPQGDPTWSRKDTGHDIFHKQASGEDAALLACASCHVEGGDDGLTRWFTDSRVSGPFQRRTQNLRGKISPTAPFHWDGSFADLGELLSDTLVRRMNGAPLDAAHQKALSRFIDSIPEIKDPPATDPALLMAIQNGAQLFKDKKCTFCHSGDLFTSNKDEDIGKGAGALQVPSLRGVGRRAPYMHDGCAKSLEDRFYNEGCGGTKHEPVKLTDPDIIDLIAYLKTL